MDGGLCQQSKAIHRLETDICALQYANPLFRCVLMALVQVVISAMLFVL